MEKKIVTIIGEGYFEPISLLLEELGKRYVSHSDPIQASYYENTFSASICILSVVCIESYVMRVKYINEAKDKDIKKAVPTYLTGLYPDFPYEDESKEIFIVRDILAHNHLWEISYLENEKGKKDIVPNKHSEGDNKYKEYVNDSGTTKKLNLNVNPIKIGAADAMIVIKTVFKILLFLEEKNKNQCYISDSYVTHKGKTMKFSKVLENMKDFSHSQAPA